MTDGIVKESVRVRSKCYPFATSHTFSQEIFIKFSQRVCVRQSRPSYQLSKESRHLKSIKETLHWTSAKGTINLNSLSSKLHSKAKSLLSTMHWDSINFVLRPWGITQFGKGSFFANEEKAAFGTQSSKTSVLFFFNLNLWSSLSFYMLFVVNERIDF